MLLFSLLLFLVPFSCRLLNGSGVSTVTPKIHALPVPEHFPLISFWYFLIFSHSPAEVRNMVGNTRLTGRKSLSLAPFVHPLGLVSQVRDSWDLWTKV